MFPPQAGFEPVSAGEGRRGGGLERGGEEGGWRGEERRRRGEERRRAGVEWSGVSRLL